MSDSRNHTLLVANRGEIAVRIIRAAHGLGVRTLAVYTPSDALSPHVSLADESASLFDARYRDGTPPQSEGAAYLSSTIVLAICKARGVTLLHPGYGFLSENAAFAEQVHAAGIGWLGPPAKVIRAMGLKHEARMLAEKAGVPVVPGSGGLVEGGTEGALHAVGAIGYPVMIKATAGGGGMGLVVCQNDTDILAKWDATGQRAQTLFNNPGLFLERYFPAGRHIEVQVFGNGKGHVVHFGERECSVQRRHQKVIEEAPSPFLRDRPEVRKAMCDAAVRLCKSINYSSAGTVEFIVDDTTAEFFFLEMNTRIQVEHPVTEAAHPGLDLVALMIRQGLAECAGGALDPAAYAPLEAHAAGWALEARVYAEDPAARFRPCTGVLQQVALPEGEHIRADHWISTGTTITPHFDPLLCKLIVRGPTRKEALARLQQALDECKIYGPTNNVCYLRAICADERFQEGKATTRFLDNFEFTPRTLTVLSPGLESSIQDLPGRAVGLGIPLSGPMDARAFCAANLLAGNAAHTTALEVVVVPGCELRLRFHAPACVAVCGKRVSVRVDGEQRGVWERVVVPKGGRLDVGGRLGGAEKEGGFRVYVAIRGGFPEVPEYLGSKSTSTGFGGYQGRTLTAGDQLALGDCDPTPNEEPLCLPASLIPIYPTSWDIHVLSGPHASPDFLAPSGIESFFSTTRTVSVASNRMGIRLESAEKIGWARESGGEGGAHPSNILDNGYAYGTVNINGDTPVIFGPEGPDMGGYTCLCTVASADMWKLGQLSPGCTVSFKCVTWEQAMALQDETQRWLQAVTSTLEGNSNGPALSALRYDEAPRDPRLHVVPANPTTGRPKVVYRQAGDSAILIEFGEMTLDFLLRARIHAFEEAVKRRGVDGIWALGPCIRSTICRYDPKIISQRNLLSLLLEIEQSLPDSVVEMEFPGRKITFPAVLDDRWNREALEKYMRTQRDKAAYLPSNIEYLARNNGLDGGPQEALQKLMDPAWLVFGVGFYSACPFLVPIDPRCRLVGQKMNPSRTYTPRGALGIAGPVTAIYPIDSPGGYQLFGRTLPAWHTWGKGPNFESHRPWLLQPFDQVHFEPVSEAEYIELEKDFDAGRYSFKIEPAVLSMKQYTSFVESVAEEVLLFETKKAEGVALETAREQQLLQEWESAKKAQTAQNTNDYSLHDNDAIPSGTPITASVSAGIWKMKCTPGQVIHSADDVLLILEAMKTEIDVTAGEENVGRKVKSLGRGIREGATVHPGDVLIVLE